jgi:hypothetical protein
LFIFFSTREEDLDECVKQAAKQKQSLAKASASAGSLRFLVGLAWVSAGVGVRTHALDTAQKTIEHDRINLNECLS